MRRKDEQDYLAWARHLIDDKDWNWHCRSRRCRRNGCQNVWKCEPQQRDRLNGTRITLVAAQLEENSQFKEVREGPGAALRRAVLANARRRGFLPLPGWRT